LPKLAEISRNSNKPFIGFFAALASAFVSLGRRFKTLSVKKSAQCNRPQLSATACNCQRQKQTIFIFQGVISRY